MQLSRFSNGGFVIHKIRVAGYKMSAWYDKSGKLLDWERYSLVTGKKMSNRIGEQLREALNVLGRRYR